ncbi:MAG: hypothetical protein WCT77_00330 [Bacteroidota bacterium]
MKNLVLLFLFPISIYCQNFEAEISKLYTQRDTISCSDPNNDLRNAAFVEKLGGLMRTYVQATTITGGKMYEMYSTGKFTTPTTGNYLYQSMIYQGLMTLEYSTAKYSYRALRSTNGRTFTDDVTRLPYYVFPTKIFCDDYHHIIYAICRKTDTSMHPDANITTARCVVLRSLDFGDTWQFSHDNIYAMGTITVNNAKNVTTSSTITVDGNVLTEGVDWTARNTQTTARNIDCAKTIANAINSIADDKYKCWVADSGLTATSPIVINVFFVDTAGVYGNGKTIISSDGDISTTNFTGGIDLTITQMMDTASINFFANYPNGVGQYEKNQHVSGAGICDYYNGNLYHFSSYVSMNNYTFNQTPYNNAYFVLAAKLLTGTLNKPSETTWHLDTIPQTYSPTSLVYADMTAANYGDSIYIYYRNQGFISPYEASTTAPMVYTASYNDGLTWSNLITSNQTSVRNSGTVIRVPRWNDRLWLVAESYKYNSEILMRIWSERVGCSRICINTFNPNTEEWSDIYRFQESYNEQWNYFGRGEVGYSSVPLGNTIESVIYSPFYKTIYIFTIDYTGSGHKTVYLQKLKN